MPIFLYAVTLEGAKTTANYHAQIHSSIQIKVGEAFSHVPYTPAGRVR